MKQTPLKNKNAQPAKISQKLRLKKKQNRQTFMSHIHKVLQTIHPQLSISKNALEVVNQIIFDIFEKIMQEVSILIKLNNIKTLRAREILTAVRLLFSGDLARHAVSEGVLAVQRYRYY
ncbi:unnamed protein product [Paramecium sonneborni]|uniref:Core Histone H2A/H2B/H3 domain-containing protein n=1 Tax=Paramecium sonneborni TaxID=65129 RepID=A0A8S1RJM3_9CILI|nr:unnamed protein product [Paramecium sonneborni]